MKIEGWRPLWAAEPPRRLRCFDFVVECLQSERDIWGYLLSLPPTARL